MRAYIAKDAAKRARKNKISNETLCDAIARAEQGYSDGHLGKFLVKQRIGRSGDYRTIIVHKKGDLALILHIFEKSRKANLTPDEETTFRDAAKEIAALSENYIEALVGAGEWIEIDYDKHQKDVPE